MVHVEYFLAYLAGLVVLVWMVIKGRGWVCKVCSESGTGPLVPTGITCCMGIGAQWVPLGLLGCWGLCGIGALCVVLGVRGCEFCVRGDCIVGTDCFCASVCDGVCIRECVCGLGD